MYNLPTMRRSLRLCKKRKTENNPGDRNSADVVPWDLLIEILNRLPAKSVGRFLLVSKSWAKIIRSKDFFRSFPFRSLSQPLRLLMAFKYHKTGRLSCSFFSSSSMSSSSTSTSTSFLSRITSPSPNRPAGYHIYYVNGLMSIGDIICNPCTGKSITLPRLIVNTGRPRLDMRFFGYDPVNNQYKELCMSPIPGQGAPWSDFQVFTLGAKQESWRLIDCSIPHSPRSKGLCIDGFVYYIALTGIGLTQLSLMRFDLKSENFDIFARVSEDIRALRPLGSLTLKNYHGKVATPIQPFRSLSTIDLFVFEHGKQDFLELSLHNLPGLHLHMKCITHTGETIFAPHGSGEANVIHYDPKIATSKKIKIEVDANCKHFSGLRRESYAVVVS